MSSLNYDVRKSTYTYIADVGMCYMLVVNLPCRVELSFFAVSLNLFCLLGESTALGIGPYRVEQLIYGSMKLPTRV